MISLILLSIRLSKFSKEIQLGEFFASFVLVNCLEHYFNFLIFKMHFHYFASLLRIQKTLLAFRNLLEKEKVNKSFLAVLHDELKLTYYFLKWWEAGTDILPDSASIFDNEQIARNLTYCITIIVRSLDEK